MGNKEKAIEELKKQIQEGKERLGPEGVKRLQELAKNNISPSNPNIPEDSVPYDKETALKALELFIQNHGDPEWLRQEILKKINKTET